MNTINRTLLIVIPKKPYLDWVKSFENGEPDFDNGSEHYSAYLISDKYDEFNYKNYLKNHYMDIFEEELYSMIRDSDWAHYSPHQPTWTAYQRYYQLYMF